LKISKENLTQALSIVISLSWQSYTILMPPFCTQLGPITNWPLVLHSDLIDRDEFTLQVQVTTILKQAANIFSSF